MERDFYRDEFEQLLKDSTEDFKMYPSRKVWHSIYNDLHPDRKWPSLAVCLLLLTAILYVGVSNNNSINSASRKNANALAAQMQMADNSQSTFTAKANIQNTYAQPQTLSTNLNTGLMASAEEDNFIQPVLSLPVGSNSPIDLASTRFQSLPTDQQPSEQMAALTSDIDGKMSISIVPSQPVELNTASEKSTADVEVESQIRENFSERFITDQIVDIKKPETDGIKNAGLTQLTATNSSTLKDTREKEWIEDYAFHNKPPKRKKILEGFDGEFYLTPGVGYRVMFLNSDYKKINSQLVAANSAARYAEAAPLQLNQQMGLTMEMGGNISKKINKNLRIKAGLQLNISDYITYAKKLDHPGQTMLALTSISNNMINFENRSTQYANVPGENTSQLHNKTIQISVPVGADFKVLGSGKVGWHIGGSVQPTYVAGGYAYLVSADNNYFIEDASMLRRWNLNGAVESFVSIKTKQGGRINLGPQFRYSLFSIYKDYYSFTEKPYSLGFKIGFSKSF